MKKITVLDIKFYPHTVRWYRRKKSKQDSTQVSCYDGFAHIERRRDAYSARSGHL